MQRGDNVVIITGFLGTALVLLATLIVAAEFSPDTYSSWGRSAPAAVAAK